VLIPDAGHGGILDKHMTAVWTPILAFIKERIDKSADNED